MSGGFSHDQLVHQVFWNRLVEREAHRALRRVKAAQLFGEGVQRGPVESAVALRRTEVHRPNAKPVGRKAVADDLRGLRYRGG